MSDEQETPRDPKTFDFAAFPEDTLFYDRRAEAQRRRSQESAQAAEAETKLKSKGNGEAVPTERRAKKERRRRIDPTTFEKQYTDDEMEFMNAMQRFKVSSGKSFPSHGEVLNVAFALGYRKPILDEPEVEIEPEIENELQMVEVLAIVEPSAAVALVELN